MTASFGIGMFFFGVTVTVIGFFIAYIVASKHHKAEEEAKLLDDLTSGMIETESGLK